MHDELCLIIQRQAEYDEVWHKEWQRAGGYLRRADHSAQPCEVIVTTLLEAEPVPKTVVAPPAPSVQIFRRPLSQTSDVLSCYSVVGPRSCRLYLSHGFRSTGCFFCGPLTLVSPGEEGGGVTRPPSGHPEPTPTLQGGRSSRW